MSTNFNNTSLFHREAKLSISIADLSIYLSMINCLKDYIATLLLCPNFHQKDDFREVGFRIENQTVFELLAEELVFKG
jgi:hypothetical protein